jgi:hypothetical protein
MRFRDNKQMNQSRASRLLSIPIALTLAACSQQHSDAVERISLDKVGTWPSQPLPSPDTQGAEWQPLDGARSIRYGKPGEPPFLTIACELSADGPPRIRMIRHAAADPGAKALFAVIGPRLNARFNIDARRDGTGWRWESVTPADNPLLDVFGEGGTIEATLPGAGTLKLSASDQPGRLVAWCRRASPSLQPSGPA